MDYLWNRLTFSNKAKLPSGDEEAQPKRSRKQSLSARSRKSLSLIFPSIYGDPMADKENGSGENSELKCEEAVNYPVYDPDNPDHNTAYQPSTRRSRSRSWSPFKEQVQRGKASLRAKSPSPTRILTSSRKALHEIKQSVRNTAAAIVPSTPPILLEEPSPIGRDSEKSLKSQRSVHWRTSESTTFTPGADGQTSPINIPKDSSPSLPDFDYSEHFLGSQIALTARPQPMLILSAIAQADQRPDSVELQRPVIEEIMQHPLLTPMPGTNLPLEDPFDDAAAVLDDIFKIHEDSDCASDNDSISSEAVASMGVAVSSGMSSSKDLIVAEFVDQGPVSRASSRAFDGDDDDSDVSKETSSHEITTCVQSMPPAMAAMRLTSVDSPDINRCSEGSPPWIPSIEISIPCEDDVPKCHTNTDQETIEIGSQFGLEAGLEEVAKQVHNDKCNELWLSNVQDANGKRVKCGQDCRIPSLTEPVKQEITASSNSPLQVSAGQLTTAKKLPPFHLKANIMSTSPPRETPAFRFSQSSDESMVAIDETEYSLQMRKNALLGMTARKRTPSPVEIPLPTTPMPTNL